MSKLVRSPIGCVWLVCQNLHQVLQLDDLVASVTASNNIGITSHMWLILLPVGL